MSKHDPSPSTSARIEERELPVSALRARGGNRPLGDEEALEELAASIRIHGLLHPVHVRALPDDPKTFEVIAGERRWRAHELLGLSTVRCRVYRCDDSAADAIRVAENEHRLAPSAYDTAVALRDLRNQHGWTSAEPVAEAVGLRASRAYQYLSVFKGSDRLLAAMQQHRLSLGVALELLKCEKQFGEAATRKYIAGVVENRLGPAELKRERAVRKHGKRAVKKATDVQRTCKAMQARMRKLLAQDPEESRRHLAAIHAWLAEVVGADKPPTAAAPEANC